MGRLTGDPDIDATDPALEQDLRAIAGLASGYTGTGSGREQLDSQIAVAGARVVYLSAVIQSRAARRMEDATKRLVTATWVLAGSTAALVLTTIALIWVTAK